MDWRRGDRISAWGLPVFESTLTLIEGQQFYYQDRSAVSLAATASAEAKACLLWQCSAADALAPAAPAVPARIQRQVDLALTLPLTCSCAAQWPPPR